MSGPASIATDTAIPDQRRLNSKANLEQAGVAFEAIFVEMMLRSMRQTKLGEDLFESPALDQFRGMQDAEVARTMAGTMPFGLGRAVTDFLARGVSAGTAETAR